MNIAHVNTYLAYSEIRANTRCIERCKERKKWKKIQIYLESWKKARRCLKNRKNLQDVGRCIINEREKQELVIENYTSVSTSGKT